MAGVISFYKLDTWFTTEFTKEQQIFMDEKYKQGSTGENILYFGTKITKFNGSPSYFLTHLLMWFDTKNLYEIAVKIANKAESLFCEKTENSEDKHFYYSHLIKFYYKNREIGNNLQKAIEYCNKQVEISESAKKELLNNPLLSMIHLPNHTGYEQLAIIEKKNKNWIRVVELSEAAKKAGWGGDWDKRITEAKGKL